MRASGLRRRIRWPTPVGWAAIVLVLVAVGAFLVWLLFDAADAWMPNVATSAFFVAVTVTVVERAIQRESARRLAPFRMRALGEIHAEWYTLCECIALDYAETHGVDIDGLPKDVFDRLQTWLDDHESAAPHRIGADGVPALVRAGLGLVAALRDVQERFGEALEDEVLLEIEVFAKDIDSARRAFTDMPSVPDSFKQGSVSIVAYDALRLGRVLEGAVKDDRWFNHPVGWVGYGRTWDGWEGRQT